MNKNDYWCNWKVRHEGKYHPADTKISMDEESAEPLLASGALRTTEVATSHATAAQVKTVVITEEQAVQKLIDALPNLDPESNAQFTQGKGDVKALRELVDFDVSTKLLNAARKAYQAQNKDAE